MPPDPPTTLCMLYIRALVLGLLSDVLQATNARRPGNEASARTDNCVLRAPHQSPLDMYAPPLLQSLDLPLHNLLFPNGQFWNYEGISLPNLSML